MLWSVNDIPVSEDTLIGTKPTIAEVGEWHTSTLELTTTADGDATCPNRHSVEEDENPDPKIVTGVPPVEGPLVGVKLTKCIGKGDANKDHVRTLRKSARNKRCRSGEIIPTKKRLKQVRCKKPGE
jgi:hypothetical protein